MRDLRPFPEFAHLRAEPAAECGSGTAAFRWALPATGEAVASLPHSKPAIFDLHEPDPREIISNSN